VAILIVSRYIQDTDTATAILTVRAATVRHSELVLRKALQLDELRRIPPLAMKALNRPNLSQHVQIAVALGHLVTKLQERGLVPECRIRHVNVDHQSLALENLLAKTSLTKSDSNTWAARMD